MKKEKTVFGLSFGFDLVGLILFAAIMVPNLVWFGVPAPNDVMREPSQTPALDIAATVFQVIAVAALVCFVQKGRKIKFDSPFFVSSALFFICYIIAWIFYYCAFINIGVIVSLALCPCFSLLAYEGERRNYFALPPTAIFAVLHTLSSCINFL